MDQGIVTVIVIVALAVLLVGAIAFAAMRSRQLAEERRAGLRARFGGEYDALSRERGPKRATHELERRVKRVEKLHIEPLSDRDRERYSDAWADAQRHFVDDPNLAVREADELVVEVMTVRGYPEVEPEQRVRDLSVDHPGVSDRYVDAHRLAERASRGDASTEELRTAMMDFRALFSELLSDGTGRGPRPTGRERFA